MTTTLDPPVDKNGKHIDQDKWSKDIKKNNILHQLKWGGGGPPSPKSDHSHNITTKDPKTSHHHHVTDDGPTTYSPTNSHSTLKYSTKNTNNNIAQEAWTVVTPTNKRCATYLKGMNSNAIDRKEKKRNKEGDKGSVDAKPNANDRVGRDNHTRHHKLVFDSSNVNASSNSYVSNGVNTSNNVYTIRTNWVINPNLESVNFF